jgi:PAS domain S-box-containing protein
MAKRRASEAQLLTKINDLRVKLQESEEALRTLRGGAPDAGGAADASEETLPPDRSLLRTLLDNLPDAVYVKDKDGRKTLANPVDWRRMGAASEADVLGKTDFDFYPHDIATAFYTDDQSVIQSGQPILDREEEITLPDGTRGWQLTSKAPVRDQSGHVVGLVGIGHDITRRKKMAEALRESEARYRLLADNIRDTVWLMDTHLRTTYISPSIEKARGYTLEETQALPLERQMTPASLRSAMEFFAREIPKAVADPAYAAGTLEIEFCCKDGTTYWSENRFSLVRDANGQPVSILGVGRDITDRKQAEDAQHRSAQRLQILHEIDAAILVAQSPETLAQAVLEQIRKLAPCDRASIVVFDPGHDSGTVLAAWSHRSTSVGKGASVPMTAFEAISDIRHGKTGVVEDILAVSHPSPVLQALAAEGMRCVVNIPLYSQDTLIGILNLAAAKPSAFGPEHVAIGREVADTLAIAIQQARMQGEIARHAAALEQRVAERTAQLVASNKELESFAYTVAHDLRSPLRALDGYSAMLLADYPDLLDDQGKHYLVRIRDASQRMAQLINDLLDLSRVTRSEMNRQEVDLSARARSILRDLQESEPQRDVNIAVAPGMTVQGDERLLRTALENLINNAWKFTAHRQGTQIEVGCLSVEEYRMSRADTAAGRPDLADMNPQARIYFVRDNGVGFDMAYAGKLFMPFQRLHGTNDFPGTGIGLATVQRIVARHGGRVWPEAAVDTGATFYFTLGVTP